MIKNKVYVEVHNKKQFSTYIFEISNELCWCKNDTQSILNHRKFYQFIDEVIDQLKSLEGKFKKVYIIFTDTNDKIICSFLLDHFWFGRHRLSVYDLKKSEYNFVVKEGE